MQRFAALGIGVMRLLALGLLGLGLLAPSGVGARSLAHSDPVRLLYTSDWSGRSEIYGIDPATGRRGQLTFGAAPACVSTSPCGYISPIPSPDGRRLVFGDQAIEGSRRTSLFVARADGSDRRRLAPVAPYYDTPAWSRDSRRVAYAAGDGIRVANADGRRDRRVDSGNDSDPTWSPDGRSLAFVRRTAAAEELVVIRRGAERVVGEDHSPTPNLVFAWSANSRWLAFSTDWADGAGTGELDLVHPDGSGRHSLLSPPATGIDFAWSPRGNWIAYSSSSSNKLDLVHPDGSDRRTLVNTSAGGLAWSADGRSIAFCCHNGLLVDDVATRSLHVIASYSGGFFTWSPHGHLLAFSAADGTRVTDGAGTTRTITRDQPELALWSPDGRWIAYTTSGSASSPAYSLRVASVSGRVRTLAASARVYGGMLSGFTWTHNPSAVHYRRPAPRTLATVSPDELTAPWPIERIAADAGRVAYAACGHVFVWTPTAKTVAQTEPVASMAPNCRAPDGSYSTSYDIYDLALTGDRVVYATTFGCNSIRIGLRLEDVTQPENGSDLAQTLGNCGGPFNPALGELAASDGLIVFGEWWETSAIPVLPPFAVTREEIHRVDGTCPCPMIASSPGPLHAADVDHGRVLAYGTNSTLVLDHLGNQLLSLPISPLAAQLAGTDLVLLLHGEVRDYDSHSGALLHTWPIPNVPSGPECAWRECPAARLVLEDAAQSLVAYTLDGQVHLLRLADGADTTIAAGTLARFAAGGLVYADGARIHIVPYNHLQTLHPMWHRFLRGRTPGPSPRATSDSAR
jgi:Tol biopolymer transport system component